jgi:hypothetical protein
MRTANTSGPGPNPFHKLIAEHRRSAKARQTAEKLQAELPVLVEEQVIEEIQKLEDRLVLDFTRSRKDAIERSGAALNAGLNHRISHLEQISSQQAQTIGNLRDSSERVARKIGSVVLTMENTLSHSAPGELLNPDTEEPGAKPVKGLCPKCASPRIRRSHRRGVWDEFLRLFFLAPFRCSRCRHQFYRF